MRAATGTATAGRAAGRAAARVGFGLAVALQLVVLYLPDPGTGGDVGVPGADKVVHAAVFALVAWTGRRAGLPARPLLAALAVHAGVSELVQHLLLPARAGDPLDVLADLVGVAAGGTLPARRRTGRHRPRRAPSPEGPPPGAGSGRGAGSARRPGRGS